MRIRLVRRLLVAGLLAFASCIAMPQDRESYQDAADLRAASLAMLVRANDPPDEFVDEIGDLEAHLALSVEHADTPGKNAEAAAIWRRLAASNGGLLGSFLARWKKSDKGLPQEDLNNYGDHIASAFDRIVVLSGVGE